MNLLTGALFAGGAAVCGYVAHRGNTSLSRIEKDKSEMLDNVTTAATFPVAPTSKPLLFQHNVAGNVGMVDIYDQKIHTDVHHVPYNTLGTGVNVNLADGSIQPIVTVNHGVVRHEENKIKFKYMESFVTDPSFGSPFLINSNRYNLSSLRDSNLHPAKHETLSGAVMRQRFQDDYKVIIPLDSDAVYKYNYFPFNGRTLYFSGTKVGEKLVYKHAASEPTSLVKQEYDDKETGAYFAKYGGIGGAIILGLCGINAVVNK